MNNYLISIKMFFDGVEQNLLKFGILWFNSVCIIVVDIINNS
jgi:hypothetical protein